MECARSTEIFIAHFSYQQRTVSFSVVFYSIFLVSSAYLEIILIKVSAFTLFYFMFYVLMCTACILIVLQIILYVNVAYIGINHSTLKQWIIYILHNIIMLHHNIKWSFGQTKCYLPTTLNLRRLNYWKWFFIDDNWLHIVMYLHHVS